MTVHSAKGLTYDHVIIITGETGDYGFPSKIKNDDILKYVLTNNESQDTIDYPEERRVFM